VLSVVESSTLKREVVWCLLQPRGRAGLHNHHAGFYAKEHLRPPPRATFGCPQHRLQNDPGFDAFRFDSTCGSSKTLVRRQQLSSAAHDARVRPVFVRCLAAQEGETGRFPRHISPAGRSQAQKLLPQLCIASHASDWQERVVTLNIGGDRPRGLAPFPAS
jgi:hypothetical protein